MARQDNTKLWRNVKHMRLIWDWLKFGLRSNSCNVAICLRAICHIPDSCNGTTWCNASTKRTSRPGVESSLCHDWFEMPPYRLQVRRVTNRIMASILTAAIIIQEALFSLTVKIPTIVFLLIVFYCHKSFWPDMPSIIMGTFIMRDIVTKIWNPSVKDIKSLSVQMCSIMHSPPSPGTREQLTFLQNAVMKPTKPTRWCALKSTCSIRSSRKWDHSHEYIHECHAFATKDSPLNFCWIQLQLHVLSALDVPRLNDSTLRTL